MANRNVARIQRICQQCNTDFTVSPSPFKAGAGKYCSKPCRHIGDRVEKIKRTCLNCDVAFFAYPSAVKRYATNFCARKCASESQRRSLKEKFWEKVDKTQTCWLWIGAITPNGYGCYRISKGVNGQAHRVSWELYFGPIPKGLYVCHKCDIRNCVRPSHLFLGSATDNMQDCAKKGRQNCKLNPDSVREIRSRYLNGEGPAKLSIAFRVHITSIHNVVKRRVWTHVK